ncbi:MAG: hypothetical protein QOE70_428 [Chthoniobacter sp.]|jgi:hypothetical protein|nr:hypothetical protein [Chthoniobacter sp.]
MKNPPKNVAEGADRLARNGSRPPAGDERSAGGARCSPTVNHLGPLPGLESQES